MSGLRTRWAAIGAAVAVTLGAGGIGIGHATTSSGERPVYVPIEPCRLTSTRPAPDTVGPRSTPLGPSETYDIDGWGAVGNCSLPNGTSALALNVTAVGATQQTNLRFFPKGAAVPTTANLNPTPGAPPTPNAVSVSLNDSNGQFSVFNRFGSVAIVIDVMGYYDHHTHDDRYYTKSETDAADAARKRMSINIRSVFVRGSATDAFGGAPLSGLRLPNSGNPGFDFNFTLPGDYAPGDDVEIQFLWHTAEADCDVELIFYFTNFARAWQEVRTFLVTQVLLREPVSIPADTARRMLWRVHPPKDLTFAPGDALTVDFYRSGGDECSGDMLIDGIEVIYG